MATSYLTEPPDSKSIRELRDELKDLNKTFKRAIESNERISLAIIAFAVVQIAIMLLQVFVDIKETEGTFISLLVLLMLGVLIVYILKMFMREDKG